MKKHSPLFYRHFKLQFSSEVGLNKPLAEALRLRHSMLKPTDGHHAESISYNKAKLEFTVKQPRGSSGLRRFAS